MNNELDKTLSYALYLKGIIMAKYHIKPDSGEPGACKAKSGNCPFKDADGNETPHFGSRDEAREAFEASQEASLTSLTSRKVDKDIMVDTPEWGIPWNENLTNFNEALDEAQRLKNEGKYVVILKEYSGMDVNNHQAIKDLNKEIAEMETYFKEIDYDSSYGDWEQLESDIDSAQASMMNIQSENRMKHSKPSHIILLEVQDPSITYSSVGYNSKEEFLEARGVSKELTDDYSRFELTAAENEEINSDYVSQDPMENKAFINRVRWNNGKFNWNEAYEV